MAKNSSPPPPLGAPLQEYSWRIRILRCLDSGTGKAGALAGVLWARSPMERNGGRAVSSGGEIDAPLLLGSSLTLCSRTPLLVARELHGAVGRQRGARAVPR